MNKNKIFDITKATLFIALLVLSVGYALADWQAPSFFPPTGNGSENAPAPINVGSTAQTRTGPLTIDDNLWVNGGNLFVDGNVGIGIIGLPAVALDIGGQVRIRNTGACSPFTTCAPGVGKVLTSVDNTGLATWSDAPVQGITNLFAGTGITFNGSGPPNNTTIKNCPTGSEPDCKITNAGTISIYDVETQRRVIGNCASPASKGLISIGQSGTNSDIGCRDFVTNVTAGGGLTGGGTGAVTLATNVGDGLLIGGDNKIKLNVAATAGDGLRFNGGRVEFESCGLTAGQTWQWNGTSWGCASFPLASTEYPGGSVMYLKARTTVGTCPSGWTTLSTYNENVGGAAGLTNIVRVCYRAVQSCQVLRLVSTAQATLADCPSPFQTANGTLTCGTSSCAQEYPPGGGSNYNYVRNCYVCY